MKRDMDLIRDLLLAIESDNQFDGSNAIQPEIGDLGITEENYKQVAYHLNMLIEAGLVQGDTDMRMPFFWRLTWKGHEFLDGIRSPEAWRWTKNKVGQVGQMGMEFIWDIAKSYSKQILKEKLNLDLS